MVYTMPNFTNGSKGIEDLGCYAGSQVEWLFPLILLLIFVTITGVGYISAKKRFERSNIFMWGAVGGTITTISSFPLLVYDCLVNIYVVIICAVITFACAILFLITDKDD